MRADRFPFPWFSNRTQAVGRSNLSTAIQFIEGFTSVWANYNDQTARWWWLQGNRLQNHLNSGLQIKVICLDQWHDRIEPDTNMGVSKNKGTPKSWMLIGFFHYFHHPFWGFSPYFWFNTHIVMPLMDKPPAPGCLNWTSINSWEKICSIWDWWWINHGMFLLMASQCIVMTSTVF